MRQIGGMNGQMGRIPFSSSQSSPPEARSSQRGLEYQHPRDPLKSSHGGERGCSSPDGHTWHSSVASASVETLEGDSGPGGSWDPQHCLWPAKKHRHVCTLPLPQATDGRAHAVKPTSSAAETKEENSILTIKWDGEQGREILTVLVYFCQFLTLMDASHTPIFTSFFCRTHSRQLILFTEDSKDMGPETTDYVRSPAGQESRTF